MIYAHVPRRQSEDELKSKECHKCDVLEKQRWIPCSERLPELGQQVLCCNFEGRVFTSHMSETRTFYGKYLFGQHFGVIAWMPLPKPYEED